MYDTALLFIVVQTNVGYTVEAEFCLQNEGAVEIDYGQNRTFSCKSQFSELDFGTT